MSRKLYLFALIPILLGFLSCGKDDNGPAVVEPVSGYYELNGNVATPLFKVTGGHPSGFTKVTTEGGSRYVLQTLSEISQLKPGFTASYTAFPTGTVNNATQSGALSASSNEGFRTYNGTIYKMFNASFERGIYRLLVDANGAVSYDTRSIKTDNTVNGSGNFVIENSTKGYYWDAGQPWAIKTFDPTALSSTGDLGNYEAVLKKDDEGIGFQGIGQHFLAIKEGKLYADVVYSKGTGLQSGMFNDFFPDVYIAVIDLATGDYEKTITISETGAIGFINDNEMYSFDTNGDLYILCQGTNGPLGQNSKIARIKANETEIDSWELKYSDIYSSDEGKFTSVFAKNGRLVVLANTTPLIGGPTGNINTGEIWKFYTVNPATNVISDIQGLELTTNSGGAYAAFELDNKVILRINAPSKTTFAR